MIIDSMQLCCKILFIFLLAKIWFIVVKVRVKFKLLLEIRWHLPQRVESKIPKASFRKRLLKVQCMGHQTGLNRLNFYRGYNTRQSFPNLVEKKVLIIIFFIIY